MTRGHPCLVIYCSTPFSSPICIFFLFLLIKRTLTIVAVTVGIVHNPQAEKSSSAAIIQLDNELPMAVNHDILLSVIYIRQCPPELYHYGGAVQ